MNLDEYYMNIALNEAKKAFTCGEVPVGVVIVNNNKIIAKAYNTKNKKKCAVYHAEINALKKATKCINNWRLNDCIIYITLFPCPMCASAIKQSRIKKIVYGTNSDNTDFALVNAILNDCSVENSVKIEGGILETECSEILKKFFLKKR